MTISHSAPEAPELKRMMAAMQMGWWTADFKNKTNTYSDFIVEYLGLQSPEVSFEDFIDMVRPDYRAATEKSFASIFKGGDYDHSYPIVLYDEEVWVRSKMVDKTVDPQGNIMARGTMQIIKKPRYDTGNQTSEQRDIMAEKQSSIYTSLLAFLGQEDISEVLKYSLQEILGQFRCSHIGMFEYDHEKQTQRCRYTVSNGKVPEMVDMTPAPIGLTPWLSARMFAHQPVIVNNLDDMPKEAYIEKSMFSEYNTRSVIAAPLVGVDQIWGYIAMDSDKVREWSSEDSHLFTSIVGVLGICLQFHYAEKKMRKDQESIRNMYKYMPSGYVNVRLNGKTGADFDYTYLDANPAASRILGFSLDPLMGSLASQTRCMAEGMADSKLDQMLQSVKSGEELSLNFTIDALGKHCQAVIFAPVPGEASVLFTDVTDLLQTQLLLEKSEGQLRNIYHNLPVGIEVYDTEGVLVDMNDKECEIFGLGSKEDALGVNLFENPNIPDFVKDKLRQHEQVEFTLNYDFDAVGDYYDTRRDKKIYLVTIATPLFNSRGEFINYLFINIDNTDITTAGLRIEAFQEMASLIGEFAQVGYANFDAYTREGSALDSWYANFNEKAGIPLTEVVGVLNHVVPEDKGPIKEFFSKVKRGEAKHLRHDVRIMRDDGSQSWTRINLMVRNYNPEEKKIGMVCVNYDITALKQTEENLIQARDKAEMSDRLKSAFLANMSHEIRTPLNAIVGFSSIMAEAEEAVQRREYLSIVQENNDLLLKLISDILDISKIEAGTMEFTRSRVDVRQLCQEVIHTFSLKTPDAVKLHFDTKLPRIFVTGDKSRMMQVISNFMTNALKFTASGSITLSYEVLDDGFIKFRVTDTGKGIASEKLDEIFSRFVKLNAFAQGTGLGLSISQSLVERMGGEIGVESEEGKGSCFWFTHPYSPEVEARLEAAASGNTVTRVEKKTAGDYKPLILVAEDIDSNFMLIEALLRKDYRLERAYNGREAIELFAAEKPDMILMDMKMPEMDGLEATTIIRQSDVNVPIVALTAFAFDSDRELALSVGCSDFLTKPVSGPDLRKMIVKWTVD